MWIVYLVSSVLLQKLVIKAEIVFEDIPATQAVIFGQDLFLPCSAIDLDTKTKDGVTVEWNLDGQWRHDKTSIFSNGTLLVPMVTEVDLGNYTCLIYNASNQQILESHPARVFHAYIKMFEVSPIPVYALEGEMISFDCITGESAPPPEVYWERNGEPFDGGDQYIATYGGHQEGSLIKQYSMRLILRALPTLDGSFNCVARNPALKIDVRSLRVLLQTAELESAPYVLEEMVVDTMIASITQPILMDCPVRGKPQVEFSWYKDGILLNGSPDFFILRNGSLHKSQTQADDEGVYSCHGTNIHGFAQSPNIELTIARINMVFVEEPQDLYVVAGLSAELICKPPFSVPPATVTWYKDNALLVPRTGVQSVQVVRLADGSWNVRFREIQKIDEGEYFCVASNDFAVPSSRTSHVVTVNIGGAPIFIEPPVGLTIEKGKLARLTCYVQGDPFPEVSWLYEGILITISDLISFRQGNQELWIGNINKGNEGTYSCRAVNRYGTIITRVYVKVLVPPVILEPVGDIIASMGDTVIIPCGIYSDPQPLVTWYKDSAAINMEQSLRFTQLHDGLYITSVHIEDSGTYLCQASNVAGSVENEGSLQVLVKPHFLVEPKDQIENMGNNVTLNCIANGSPKPQISWMFNDSALFPPDTLLSLNRETLVLVDLKWTHVGKYSCVAQSKEGSKQASATVKLRVPPKVRQIEGIPLLYQGEHLQLLCHVTGIPYPKIEWLFNRAPLEESQNKRISFPQSTTLSVKYVALSDAGIYSCKASNAAGVSQLDSDVYIIGRPSPPVLQNVETMSATSIKLSWTIDQQKSQTPVDKVIISYHNSRESSGPIIEAELDAAILQHIVENLDPATEYVFMVSAKNGAGVSDISNVLSARTYDAGPSVPRRFEVLKVKAYNVTLSWEIPLTTNGDIKKYLIRYKEKNDAQESSLETSSDNNVHHEYVLTNLKPYTWYTFRIRAATMEGDQVLWGNWTTSVDVKTVEAAPDGRPREVRAYALSSDAVHVLWDAVAQQKQNGPIKRYYVHYWLMSNLSSSVGVEVIDSLDLRVNISELDPWTWYMVKVIPENAGGIGQPSEPITVRTLPGSPGSSPQNVTAISYSADSVLVKWQAPPQSDWNSDLKGFIVQYRKQSDTSPSSKLSLGLLDLAVVIRGLDPYTDYGVRVAAFTDQISNGTGPYSDNVTIQTQQAEPGPVQNVKYTSTPSKIRLSWKPPTDKNGVIIDYIIYYHSVGSAAEVTPLPPPPLLDYTKELLNSTEIIETVFRNYRGELTVDTIAPLLKLCDDLQDDSLLTDDFNDTLNSNLLEWIIDTQNVSDNAILKWMIRRNNDLNETCLELQQILTEYLESVNGVIEPFIDVYNVTSSSTTTVLQGLESEHIYNISIAASTVVGYGTDVIIEASTKKAIPKPVTTKAPPVTKATTKAPIEVSPLMQIADDNGLFTVPVIVGGAVTGGVLLLIIFLLVCCLFVRKRRSSTDEKSKVIRDERNEDRNENNPYGQLDRPSQSPAIAMAAEDGTDSVDIHGDEVRFQTPRRNPGTGRSFMTQESGETAYSNGRFGMENPAYLDLPGKAVVKSNPSYFEEQSSSDLESMSVTMAFSSEDNLNSQSGENTLKRKSKMKNVDAAAIARLRNRGLPPGMADTDKSSLIDNQVEVVYNERTAL